MNHLKERWGNQSKFGILAILFAFSLNGSLAVFILKPIFNFIGFTSTSINPWFFWPIRILAVFIIYQITLPLSGWLFGQYKFFKNMQRKMLIRMKLIKQNQ